MELITRKPWKFHVAQDIVAEFERTILDDPRVQPARMNRAVASSAYLLAGTLQAVNRRIGRPVDAWLPKAQWGQSQRDLFLVSMGVDPSKCVPYFWQRGRKSMYLFDAWPSRYPDIARFVADWQVDHLFVSASQSAARLGDAVTQCTVEWVPEGIDPACYRQCPVSQRDIDVLQLGRKYDQYHDLIVGELARSAHVYLFEKRPRHLVFPTRDAFIDGLARTKISICVPSSITHPARAGDVATMTVRYLQSMASKCLVLGHAPLEMIELFGYNPVIEIDGSDPVGQLRHLLDRYDDYVALIERNFAAVVTHHTWRQRWQRICMQILPETG